MARGAFRPMFPSTRVGVGCTRPSAASPATVRACLYLLLRAKERDERDEQGSRDPRQLSFGAGRPRRREPGPRTLATSPPVPVDPCDRFPRRVSPLSIHEGPPAPHAPPSSRL